MAVRFQPVFSLYIRGDWASLANSASGKLWGMYETQGYEKPWTVFNTVEKDWPETSVPVNEVQPALYARGLDICRDEGGTGRGDSV